MNTKEDSMSVTFIGPSLSVDAPHRVNKLVPIFKDAPSGVGNIIFSSGELNSANISWVLFICIAGFCWCDLIDTKTSRAGFLPLGR